MSKRTVLLGVLLGLLLLAAAGAGWQKPADPPVVKVATDPPPTGFPNTGESLDYALKWPGGASLGEAHLSAGKTSHGWDFDFSLNASVPGFRVSDHYHSRANADFCSLQLEKETTHGARHTHEKTVFDYQAGTAKRTTLVEGGGQTDIDINDCAHDGLDYIFYARRELGQGHGVPKREDVPFGALYSARMEFAGVQEVTVGGKRRQADHIIAYLRGPASDNKLEIFFDRDPARTPLIVKVPLPVGTLSMELVR